MRPLGPCSHLWESSGPPSNPGGSRRGHGPAYPGDPPLQEPLPLGLMVGVRGSWAQGSGRAGGHVPGASCPGSPQEPAQWKPCDRHPLHQAEVWTRKTGCRERSGHGARRAVCARGSLHFSYCLPRLSLLSALPKGTNWLLCKPPPRGTGFASVCSPPPQNHVHPRFTSRDVVGCHVPGSSVRVLRLT